MSICGEIENVEQEIKELQKKLKELKSKSRDLKLILDPIGSKSKD